VGSAASQFFINAKEQEVRGIEISANHLRSILEESLRYCTNYSQRKNAASVEIKNEEGI
jgi:hypothetical protein